MVNRCCNPECRAEFKLLTGGEIYALERRSADTEFFWLCSACAAKFALHLDPKGRVTVRVQGVIHRAPPPHPDDNLRLISRMMRSRPNTMPSGERESSFVFDTGSLIFRDIPYAKRPRALNCAREIYSSRAIPPSPSG